MTRPPALAKIGRPRMHHAVARERLFEVIGQALRFPLVWLAAPPGAGKTTLVATFLERRDLPVVWYQVDSGDADPAAFFYYLGRAAAPPDKKRSAPLPLLAPEHASDLSAFTRRFFRHLFSRFAPRTVLVLDNFQEGAESGLPAILRDACDEIPSGINLLVVSRTEPPPAFAELEARETLRVIDWNLLRLSLEETRAVAAAKGITDEAAVMELHQEADGWAAGLTLLIERFKRTGSDVRSISNDTRESVFNYFANLIFDQAPQSTRDTLLALAFLPHITPRLAQELSGNSDAGRLLENLRRRHLFTDRRPGPEPVYEFHALFRAFLRAKATELTSREALVARLRETGVALDQRGEWEAAFHLFVQAEAWDAATTVLVARAAQLLSTGRWQTLLQWIEVLPKGQRRSEPWTEYWLACGRAQTAPAQAIPAFERAEEQFFEHGDRRGRVLSLAGLLHACAIDHTNFPATDRWLDVLATELAVRPSFLTPEDELAGWSAFLSAAFYVRPWHVCIGPGVERIESLLKTIGEAAPALRAATIAVIVAIRSGDIARAQRLAPVVEMLAAQDWRSPVERAWGLFQLANQRFVIAEYEAAREFFDRTWSLAEANGLRAVLTASLTYRFMLEFRLEDRAAVDASMRRILALPAPVHAFSQGLLTCYQARHAQIRGASQVAADLAECADAHILRVGAGFHELNHGLIHGEILLAAGRVSKARTLIQRSRAIIERTPILSNYLPSLLLVEAWLAEQEGREEDSHRALREALQQSQVSYGWCQMRYVDTTCAHMFRVALRLEIEPDTARRLIRTFRLKPRETDIAAWPWPLRVHALGRFEVQTYDRYLEFGRRTPRKVLALLKALVALGPREVPEQQLIDALWPDEEGDAAHKALSVTVLRLRRVLGDNEFIRQRGGKLSIDRQKGWVDAWSFEQRLAQASLNGSAGSSELQSLEETLALYEGALLPEDSGESWTVPARERLRAKFVHALGGLGKHQEALGRYEDAIAWYLKGLDADAIVEPFYQGLMRCYDRLDRRPEALGAYRRLRQILSATLGLQPSKNSEKLYQSLRLG